ncbi:DUF4277 domain-containing protein [Alicyclobacillus sp. ALC3]|uniref:DUF4277 domain-containing protein n=1 Tax=Alicyclobacillus sp. ALC3 TaxID=2796143 RepID=UPI0023787501|nr:DUF4277 domain-containing protein [Alicyclobacillus sp. ALC3]WDL98200.1 DUF4277 domain-containing protein [Alicyclobacillus sp. ALC3]
MITKLSSYVTFGVLAYNLTVATLHNFYEERDVEVLLGDGVSFADLNNDAPGRALDILYDLDLDTVYPQIALATVKKLRSIEQFDDLLPVHADMTPLTRSQTLRIRAIRIRIVLQSHAGIQRLSSFATTYKIQSFRRKSYGRTYRFIAVRSMGMTPQKEHKLEDVLGREQDTTTKAIEKARKAAYNCESDVRTGCLEKDLPYSRITGTTNGFQMNKCSILTRTRLKVENGFRCI